MTVRSRMNIGRAVVHGVMVECNVVHGVGALWWLSYINFFFRDRGAALVGRVGVLSLFTASPAQFTQLNNYVNVICAKICRNQIFAENRFFFVKKKCTKKNSAPFRFIPEIKSKNSITSRILTVFFGTGMDVLGTSCFR